MLKNKHWAYVASHSYTTTNISAIKKNVKVFYLSRFIFHYNKYSGLNLL